MARVAFIIVACLLASGCGRSNVPQPRKIEVVAYDPLDEMRSFLTGYAQGLPVGSERDLFPKVVEEIQKTDPDKAAIVEAGLNAILKSPASVRVEAKKLLERL